MKRIAAWFVGAIVFATLAVGTPTLLNASETKAPEAAPAATAPAPEANEPGQASTGYVHDWKRLPPLDAQMVGEDRKVSVTPEPGSVLLVVFLASWCEPCQDLIDDLKRVETKYGPLHTRIVYVFSHDAGLDAAQYSKDAGLVPANAILANQQILKDFHNPALPTIYLADRNGWLAGRWADAKRADVGQMENLLKYLTAF